VTLQGGNQPLDLGCGPTRQFGRRVGYRAIRGGEPRDDGQRLASLRGHRTDGWGGFVRGESGLQRPGQPRDLLPTDEHGAAFDAVRVTRDLFERGASFQAGGSRFQHSQSCLHRRQPLAELSEERCVKLGRQVVELVSGAAAGHRPIVRGRRGSNWWRKG
jgi:hypothetical protein